ncbi:MAG: hypothetical protein M9894_33300 [Planctomycetes bacterium]|nr:hypothetical protein [Planctomycetota bacterium]
MQLRDRRRRALTLIEVAISLSLFVLLIVPVLALFMTSRRSVAESRHLATARLAIEHQLERMRAIANTGDGAGTVGFPELAHVLTVNPTFTVPGLPPWQGGPHGRIRVCLDETKEFFTDDSPEAHDDHFARPGWDRIPYPAFGLNLDASFAPDRSPTFSALTPAATYRVLPVRVEVFWGNAATDPQWDVPKAAVNAVIAPKTGFRRG